jgi:hypothetical protein
MSVEDFKSRTTVVESNNSNWGDIASSTWHRESTKQAPLIKEAQEATVVMKPVEIDGQIVVFPVKVCPPGPPYKEPRRPRPEVQGGSCSGN